MKRKILTVLYVILIIILLKLAYNLILNTTLIHQYKKGQYSESNAKLLTYANFPQAYVANYNYANILYQNGEYEKAKNEYKKALSGNVPKEKECNIRINYALAICKMVQVNEADQDSIKKAIKDYESAIDVLTEKGCANKKNNNGHNQNAQQLKKDIQKEIDRLKKLQKDEERNQDEEDPNEKEEDEQEENDDKTTKDEETIEAKIQDIKEDATQEQRETVELYKNRNKSYNRKSKNW